MNEDDELRAALSEAEAELAAAVLERANPELDGATVEARIGKARARCRQIRALIVERDRTQAAAKPQRQRPAPEAALSKPQKPVSEAAHSQHPNSLPEAPRPKRRSSVSEAVNPQAEKTAIRHRIRHFRGVLERWSGVRSAADWRVVARQSLTLLALVLAYLQFYFLDVQLQLSRLPSLAIFVHG